MKAAVTYREGYLAVPIAIGLFAGLRPSEIEGLKKGDIKSDGNILVQEGKKSRKPARLVPIPPNLENWLKAFPFRPLPTNRSKPMKALKDATKAENWVQDIIRHTSISFQLAREKNEALVAYNNGTSVQMINDHYRQLIPSEKVVEKFWKITPYSLEKVKIKLPRTRKRIQWPQDEELLRMVEKASKSAVAKKLGASEAAVRKKLSNTRGTV